MRFFFKKKNLLILFYHAIAKRDLPNTTNLFDFYKRYNIVLSIFSDWEKKNV